MLDIKYIRENVEQVKEEIKNRHMKVDVDLLLEFDVQKREIGGQIDELRAARNKGSKGKPSEEEIAEMKRIGEEIKTLEEKAKEINEKYTEILLQVPNKTHKDSPIGGEEDYKVIHVNKEPQIFEFQPKDHEELLTNLGALDFERGAKVVGSKFYFSKNNLVKLNRALISYGIDVAEKYGFELIETPDLAKIDVLVGAGFNPRGDEDQIYTIENTDFALIGTAEITTLGYHANETLDLSNGPIKYLAISHCFRKEAGAYGRTSKGLYRVHQFTKLEMFVFCKPEESDAMHAELLQIEKEIADGLDIPYRVIDIPTGDLGAPAYRKYDLEAYMIMKGDENKQGDYGEITSTSNCLDYQARRLNIKYENEEGKKEFVHTLNGTAVVLSRFPIVLIENNQNKDGSVHIPEVLQKYMGGKTKIG
ncbi:serine--tRNA ligase [Patescibacteria group bacterium]|nr:serine--tRNA ligase [Patescibacteria group bacterium]MBU1721970.1 serine--tRNA ligase [Patescibacteria group bacterium]MBU1901282.1 serine--tRNA ligase [Patescibacteria group bacterium]